jgi:chemotaxis family two-component system response regulator Rcp1
MGEIIYKPLDILLVEDNEADVKLTLIAFGNGKIKNNIKVVSDGEEAINYLYNHGKFQDKKEYPRPDLILLDINLPKFDGFTVLQKVKQEPLLRKIPVIILTSSSYEADILNSYNYGATGFIQKPVDFEEFFEIVNGFNIYWHLINKLPKNLK